MKFENTAGGPANAVGAQIDGSAIFVYSAFVVVWRRNCGARAAIFVILGKSSEQKADSFLFFCHRAATIISDSKS